MAITFIESNGNCTNGVTNTISVSVPTTTIAGDLLVVLVLDYQTSGATDVVTDNLLSTYTKVFSVNITAQHTYSLWYVIAQSGITTILVTLGVSTISGGTVVSHFNGISPVGVDVVSQPTGTSSATPWVSGGITTNQPSELLIGTNFATVNTFVSGIQNANAWTGGWTNADAFTICSGSSASPCNIGNSFLDGSNGSIISLGYQIVSALQVGAQATGTNNGSANTYFNYPGIASFFSAAIPGAPDPIHLPAISADYQWGGGDDE